MEEKIEHQQENNEVVSSFIKGRILPKYISYNAVSKFKSIRRAIRRGHVDLISGIIYPDRPYNNRKPTLGRKHNSLKKEIYEQFRRVQ